ncbi:MAG: flagellar filament capping protein FliD [Eubacterium sp.]|jgi:hypothetical protein|nr:flagellar filament capping protein FliD [Eubacterium sp.]
MSISISANPRMVGGLFSSMNSNLLSNSKSSAFSGMGLMGGFNYSDYASIRNGSYHKLLSSYYSLDSVDSDFKSSGSGSSSGASGTSRTYNYWTKDGMVQRSYDNRLATDKPKTPNKTNTSTSKEPTSKLATIESSAEKLSDAADALLTQGSKSLFKQVTTTDKDGNKTTGYNTDAIYKAVSSYVEQYNNLMKSAGNSSVISIRASAASMADYTKANEKALSEIGITVDPEKKTLSLDAEKFKNADMDAVKKLFQGSGSYAYQVSSKASAIDYQAQYEAQKASTYNSGGAYSYNYSAGSLWNGMI